MTQILSPAAANSHCAVSARSRTVGCDIERKLAQLRDLGGDEFVNEMIELFLVQTTEQLRTAQTCLEIGDLRKLRQIGHSLKSSAGSLGATDLHELAREVEKLAVEGSDEDLAERVSEMLVSFATAREKLTAAVL